ncbi:MAG: glycosyl transferase group 1 [Acidobacteriales bacterium]|nr:glycosyl transferase group 1 [Terriglobales bacterium]
MDANEYRSHSIGDRPYIAEQDTYSVAYLRGKKKNARSSRLKVTMVAICFPCEGKPKYGIFNLRAAKCLMEYFDVTVVHLRSWVPGRRSLAISEVEGIPVTTIAIPQIPWGPTFNLLVYKLLGWSRVAPHLEDCDIVHSVGSDAGVLASGWAKRLGKHHVFQVTGSDVNAFLPNTRGTAVYADWHEYVHGVACNSTALAETFCQIYPGSKNVQTVFRGTDLDFFNPSGEVAGPLAAQRPVRFAFMGGFPASRELPFGLNTKGGETLLQAWRLAERYVVSAGASLLLLGCDPSNPHVRSWRAGLASPERVHIGGFVTPDLVPAYIRAADVVLVPSLQEGLSNLAVEASACGRPVFASDAKWASEVVVNGRTGLLVETGNVQSWSDVLAMYATRRTSLQQMGIAARQRMEELFDSRNYAPSMLKVYESAMREPIDC